MLLNNFYIRRRVDMRCKKCGNELQKSDKIMWKCKCGKTYNCTFDSLKDIQNKKDSMNSEKILKCKQCGEYLDNGSEKIYWKCVCGSVNCGNLKECVGKSSTDNFDKHYDREKRVVGKVKSGYKQEKILPKFFKLNLPLVVCMIIIICLLGSNAYFLYELNAVREKNVNISLQEKKLEQNNSDLMAENKKYFSQIESLTDDCTELQKKLDKTDLKLSKLKNQQSKIKHLNDLLNKKDNEISGLKDQIASYQSSEDDYNSDYYEDDETDESDDNNSYTVYVTDSGSKYHSAGCRYLWNSQNAIDINDAIAEGYTACSVCNP